MFKIRLYLYDSTQENNGYRGADLSKYVLQGQQYTEDITQVLDTSEITLAGFPQKESFAPETKFIADIVEFNELNEISTTTVHLCVANDTPSQPIMSDDTYFDHHISFIEPSVVAQKRLVDNISATYKLKDVSLQEIPAFPQDIAKINIQVPTLPPPFYSFYTKQFEAYNRINDNNVNVQLGSYGKYFATEGNLQFINENGETFDYIYNNIDNFKSSDGTYKAKFKMPKINIIKGIENSTNMSSVGWYASIDYSIKEYLLNDEYNPTRVWNGVFISNSNLENNSMIDESKFGEWLIEKISDTYPDGSKGRTLFYKKYTNKNATEPTYTSRLLYQ